MQLTPIAAWSLQVCWLGQPVKRLLHLPSAHCYLALGRWGSSWRALITLAPGVPCLHIVCSGKGEYSWFYSNGGHFATATILVYFLFLFFSSVGSGGGRGVGVVLLGATPSNGLTTLTTLGVLLLWLRSHVHSLPDTTTVNGHFKSQMSRLYFISHRAVFAAFTTNLFC